MTCSRLTDALIYSEKDTYKTCSENGAAVTECVRAAVMMVHKGEEEQEGIIWDWYQENKMNKMWKVIQNVMPFQPCRSPYKKSNSVYTTILNWNAHIHVMCILVPFWLTKASLGLKILNILSMFFSVLLALWKNLHHRQEYLLYFLHVLLAKQLYYPSLDLKGT